MSEGEMAHIFELLKARRRRGSRRGGGEAQSCVGGEDGAGDLREKGLYRAEREKCD